MRSNNLLRGEILGLTGSADFYAESVNKLKDEFKTSLKVYLESCEKHNINPYADNKFIKQEDIESACGAGVLLEVLDYIENK